MRFGPSRLGSGNVYIYDVYTSDTSKYYPKITADLAAGAGIFDIVFIGPVYQFAKPGWLEPLNSYLTNPRFDTSDFYQLAAKGDTYVFPVMTETYPLTYRKALFAKYGINVPDT
jgi:ABC-type glycerol-3-phosphate transport system substrate-binding protein